MITTEVVIGHARKYVGIPWHHQGRNEHGMDCLGLIISVARDLGLDDVVNADRIDYPLGRHPALRPSLETHLRAIPVASAGPGDVVLIEFPNHAYHLGILTDRGIIHSSMRARKMIEQPLHSMWKNRITGAYQFKR